MNSINHNLMAANVANNLNAHYGRLATSVQRISSGLRINSSADDAAGLAIRELMRADVAALNQGARNANDAISMLQVADGALAIIDEKLIRMKELAEQAATGTYNSTQRLIIDSEYQAMAAEIDRIARATDFNGIKLLDGSLSGKHNGSGLQSTGMMKIHFGAANDSAEDYYYVQIGDCTTKGLGLGSAETGSGSMTTQITVETLVTDHKTFKPVTSYMEYTDPDTGNKYYTDGDYWFSDVDDPAGSSLSWETNGDLIERLRMTPAIRGSNLSYTMYKDPVTSKAYYTKDGGATFAENPHDYTGTLLDSANDNDIIARLQKTSSSVSIYTTWQTYEAPDGKKYYTCDGGLTYVPNVSAPQSNILNSRDPAHAAIIGQLKVSMTVKMVPAPTESVVWHEYTSVTGAPAHYSCDGGQTFVKSPTNPETTRLDPSRPKDKLIIDSLVPAYKITISGYRYDQYINPDTNKYYYTRDGKTFLSDLNDPSTVVTDTAILDKLKPCVSSTHGKVEYATYQDPTNNNKIYYSADNGKTYFDDLANPKGSAIGSNDPLYPALAGNLVKRDTTTTVETWFELYKKNGVTYYTPDGGQTFYSSSTGGNLVLDASNPSDKPTIDTLAPVVSTMQSSIRYYSYIDPVTNFKYHSLVSGTQQQFVGSWIPSENIVLDASIPEQKVIIDRLVQERKTRTVNKQMSFPEKYYLYKDPDTGTVYYKPEPDGSVTSRPNDPYNKNYQLDPANPAHKQILDRLVPLEDVLKRLEHVEVTQHGGTVSGLTISTQQAAQGALVAIDRAIVSKDQIRAHLGALQNRLENTVTSLNIQAENMQNAESRISDADVANEMTNFVRNQILTQSAVAMLGQANSYPHMLIGLITG